MNLKTTRVDLWITEISDQPGSLARTLRAIADYGGDLDLAIARRTPEKPGRGMLLVAPLVGHEQLENASEAGLRLAEDLRTLRVEGEDRPGAGSKIMKAIADAGVNLHEISMMVLGSRFVCYVGFDSLADLEKAEMAIKGLNASHWHFFHHRTEHAVA
jgi:hypothetical protein